VITAGPLQGQRIQVSRELIVGREHSDLEFDDPEVSRRHARLRPVETGLEIEDLGSSNGTRVDGTRIENVVTAGHGAVVGLGKTTFTVELMSAVGDERGAPSKVTAPPSLQRTATDAPYGVMAPGQRSRMTERRPGPPPAGRRGPAAPEDGGIPREFGAFRAPTQPRRAPVATRLWAPMMLTYVSIGGTAAALILYFATRQ